MALKNPLAPFLFKILIPTWVLIHLTFIAPPPALTNEKTIKIAAIFSLSGGAATSNAPSIQGIRSAVQTLNKQGGLLGKKIQLMEIDNQSTPIGSSVAAEKAVRLGAVAIIGCNWSSHSLAVAKVAQREGIPMISNISTHPDVTLTGNYIFRVCFTDIIQGKAMASFARKTLKARTGILLVNLNSNYGIVLSEQFKRYFESSGGSILSRLEYKNNSDLHHFQQLVERVKKSKPNVVFIPGFVESGIIIREMSRTGVTAIPLGGDGWGFDDFFKAGGSELKQGYYCTHWSRQDSSPRSLEYLARRQNKNDVWAAEVLAVDAINLLAHAVNQAGTTTDGSKIREALSQVQDFKGITGTISFDKNGDPIKDVIIMGIRNGCPLFQSRFNPDKNRKSRALINAADKML
ncbi:amino acid/amide ABC transporter substrate-binding protein, HAAT family [Desulfocicer vacuolatum DSM 3385]|uniref:Amino acid/amide ABC transporter substrate-binding protein, HAAT family n=1 Tax=Desulfocicer vacuolatum DSM 3385 TaxID=1121400 RepID=A0A1W2DFJ1_9BACT|nr:ABC transporter substrate-binding protein [Desulfocicer vacuolatum]SMC96205.1 amino acid/amide ABC transporter substrate-binding protein, HAAT family [Desulfocicer vacuolatum DSM 3385]